MVALAQNQSLLDLAEQIYEDHSANPQVVLSLLEHQESLPKPLLRRIYEDHSQQPEVLLALVACQQLPGTWPGRPIGSMASRPNLNEPSSRVRRIWRKIW